jgi:tetratricopeptide (TPR) repeat protein
MVVGNLREALEIYIDLADREAIVRTINGLTDALFWVGRFQEGIETVRRGLTFLQAEVSADRVRLLSTLGEAHTLAGVYEPALEALREALEIARQLSDSKLEARVLGARSFVNVRFLRVRESVTDGLLSERLGGSALPHWQQALASLCLHVALLQRKHHVVTSSVPSHLHQGAIQIANDTNNRHLFAGEMNFAVARIPHPTGESRRIHDGLAPV